MSNLARSAFWLAWQVVRLPALAFLLIIEPVVRLVLSSAALLGVFTALLFEFSAAAPTFPFWGMIAISVGCMLALMTCYALLRLFRR
jgi:hypothetical protein